MKDWVTRHPLASYFFVAYTVSWSIAVPLALQAQGVLSELLPRSLHYLTMFGPAAAALLITWLLHEPPGTAGHTERRSVAHTTFWWTVGFGSPLLLFVIALVAARIAGQTPPAWRSLGHVNYLPDLGLAAWGLWLATGVGEELGWRGFTLPRLQRTHSAMSSTLLLAIGWAGWHLPAFFYVPSYTAMGLRILPGFFLGVLAGAIVLTWLYNSSGGSVYAAALWHASFNFVTASPNASGLVAAVTSTLVMIWAFVIIWRYEWATLASSWRSVRATHDEKTRTLPGDERIPDAIDTLTHGVTIQRPPRDVWPWLVQMGAGRRAGWYSYDWLENLFGFDIHTADRIIPEYQDLAIGDPICMARGVCASHVTVLEPNRWLSWQSKDEHGDPVWTFTFGLFPADATHTRLIVRESFRSDFMPPAAVFALAIPDGVMELKSLNTVKNRVEGIKESALITPLEIIVWLTALAVGLVAATLFATRSDWKAPVTLIVASALVLLPITFLFPPFWLRILLDVGLLAGLAWTMRQPVQVTQLQPSSEFTR